MRSVLLTFRMHRFEVVIAVALMALTAISAVVAFTHVTAANPSGACWMQHWDFSGTQSPAPGCEASIETFWSAAGEAGFVASPVGVSLPFIVGLLLGIPIVGRELELRTAAFAWSLSGNRTRWLLSRLLPMLGVAFVGLVIAGGLIAWMAVASHPWNFQGPGRIPDLTELGSEGPSLVARGLMAFGIALLAGAVIGRTLPAVALAAILCFGWMFVGAPQLQALIGDRVATWQGQDSQAITLSGSFGSGFQDTDGTFLTVDQAITRMHEECPECDPNDQGWMYEHLTAVSRVAPIAAYPTFEWAEILVTTTIGMVCLLLTFPVVSRRRPS